MIAFAIIMLVSLLILVFIGIDQATRPINRPEQQARNEQLRIQRLQHQAESQILNLTDQALNDMDTAGGQV